MPACIRFMLRRVIKAPDFLRLDIVTVSGMKTIGNAQFTGSE